MEKNKGRLWGLYNLLTAEPDKWWTQKEICDWVEGYTYKDRPNDRCPQIRHDMLLINEGQEFEKLIVCKDYCFKVASDQETIEYIKDRIRRLKAQAKQIKDIRYKVYRNGKMNLFTDKIWSSYYED
jgi:hypothetical protein